MTRWILLIVILTGCGDTFESGLFSEGQNDGGTSDAGSVESEFGPTDGPNETSGLGGTDGGPPYTDSAIDMGDRSTDGPGEATDGATPDATPDASEPLACPSSACTDYCALQDDLPSCSDGKCGCQ